MNVNVINHLMLENIYENCKCRKKLMFKLVEELNENIDGNEIIYNGNLNDYEKECDSCTI